MTGQVDQIEAVSRQRQIECFHKRSGCQFARDKHVAANANSLAGNDRFDRMQLFPEA